MSSVPIQDAAGAPRKIDTFQRTDGPDTIETQAVAIVDPATGNALVPTAAGRMPVEAASLPLPTGAATQATLATLLAAAQAIQTAAEALNGKTTAVNTGAIGGTVNVGNFPSTQAVSGPLTDTQLRAAAVPVSAAALPLPSGAATAAAQDAGNTSLASIDGKLPALSGGAVPVTLGGTQAVTGPLTDAQLRAAAVLTSHEAPPFLRVGFAEVGSGLQGKAADELTVLQTGAGQAVSQSAGNLVITTGTTTNAETVIRSVDTFAGSLLARMKVTLSQRIANQTFRLELADLIGEGLAYTINSATSVTVTFPTTNPFTAANVGQSLRLSRITGAAGIPGRYAIASVSGLSVNFTVAGWPATGTGTLTLYGWNYIASEYTGTVATNSSFDAQRRGWNSGNTTATINTTASPGHVAQIAFDVHTAGYSDALVASNTGYQWANRASRVENLPDPEVPLYLFIVVQNGSVAPASTTTLTIGFIQVEDQGRQKVRIASSDPAGSHALPVQVLGGLLGTQPVSGTVTANVAGAGITGGVISPLTVAGSSAEASSAKTTNGNSAAGLTNASGRNAHFIVNVSASSGTTPTLVVRVQIQDPVSSAWVDLPGAATGTITGTGATLLTVNNLPRTYRFAWVITGTTPSFTFSIGFLPVI